MDLAEKKVQVSRQMIKKTFQEKGIPYASELSLKNIQDLEKVIDWNIENQVLLYRLSSNMFPWMSEYEFEDLPDITEIKTLLARVGEKVKQHDLRLTYHPGPFNVLATRDQSVLEKTIKELRQHGEVMDMIGLPRTPFAKINLHVGGAYGDKPSAIDRFCQNYLQLPDTARTRLTVENDDKANMFSISDLLEIHQRIGIPLVFDYLHHQLCTGGWSEEEAMLTAVSTWPKSIRPVVHYSSSRKKYEDQLVSEVAHADYVYQHINLYGQEADIMLEAKAKERAVLRYLEEFSVDV